MCFLSDMMMDLPFLLSSIWTRACFAWSWPGTSIYCLQLLGLGLGTGEGWEEDRDLLGRDCHGNLLLCADLTSGPSPGQGKVTVPPSSGQPALFNTTLAQ